VSSAASGWPVLDTAQQALRAVVAAVPDDGWKLPTPCSRWNVTQVLQHAALDQNAYATSITGAEKPAEDAFNPSGVLAGPPLRMLDHHLGAAASAYAGVAPDAGTVPVPLPPFTLPASTAAEVCALDAHVHAWDLAVATGQASPLTDEQATALLPGARTVVTEALRQYGMFAAPIEPAPGAGDAEVLLGFLGRRADWSPGRP
jgi:uncharacterized protein (TIGR03086 family)